MPLPSTWSIQTVRSGMRLTLSTLQSIKLTMTNKCAFRLCNGSCGPSRPAFSNVDWFLPLCYVNLKNPWCVNSYTHSCLLFQAKKMLGDALINAIINDYELNNMDRVKNSKFSLLDIIQNTVSESSDSYQQSVYLCACVYLCSIEPNASHDTCWCHVTYRYLPKNDLQS